MNSPRNKKIYLSAGLIIILASLFFLINTSPALAAGCEKDPRQSLLGSYFNPLISFAEKVAKGFGYEVALAAPVSCSSNDCIATCDVGCSDSSPTATISWEAAPSNIVWGGNCTWYWVPNRYILTVGGVDYTLGNVTSYTVSNLASNTTYDWSVEAYDCAPAVCWSTAYCGVTDQPYGSFTTPNCAPLPTCPTFSASPSTITQGQSSTLSWGSAPNATNCSIDQGIGSVSCSGGSRSVSPVNTTTYTLTATGPGGSASCPTVLTVNIPPSTCHCCRCSTVSDRQWVEFDSTDTTCAQVVPASNPVIRGLNCTCRAGDASWYNANYPGVCR